MATNTDLDFFVSYARHDNANGWITRFLDALQAEHRAFSGGRDFKVFIVKDDIVFTPTAGGAYRLVIASHWGYDSGAYTLRVREILKK